MGEAAFVARRTIRNGGTHMYPNVMVLPSNDLILLGPAILRRGGSGGTRVREVPLPAGTVWRRNYELEQRTEGESTHMCFDDLYDLLRSGVHVRHRYGVGSVAHAATEAEHLRETISIARTYVRFVLDAAMYRPEEREAFQRAQRELVAEQRAERDVHKVTARERFTRGLVMRDSMGRHNPSAAAMVTGAGIGHLLRRIETVRAISTHIDRKTICIAEYIEDHLELYRELWEALRLRAWPVSDVSRSGPDLLAEERGPRVFPAIATRLREFRVAFGQITARPFRKNAWHTVRDLDVAIALAEAGERVALRQQIIKLREGIRWVFVLDELQSQLISPLSFLLERMQCEGGRHQFVEIEQRLAKFLRKLEGCSDAGLTCPVKERVFAHAKAANSDLMRDDRSAAKAALLKAAKLL